MLHIHVIYRCPCLLYAYFIFAWPCIRLKKYMTDLGKFPINWVSHKSCLDKCNNWRNIISANIFNREDDAYPATMLSWLNISDRPRKSIYMSINTIIFTLLGDIIQFWSCQRYQLLPAAKAYELLSVLCLLRRSLLRALTELGPSIGKNLLFLHVTYNIQYMDSMQAVILLKYFNIMPMISLL